MNNPVLYQALGVLSILFFLFLVYMFTKTWRWFHVLCTFLVFCAAVTFTFYVAMVHRTRAAWGEQDRKNRERAESLEEEYESLLYGNLAEVVQSQPSVRSQNARFARTVLDRGRVWRGCTPQGAPQADGTITLSTAPPTVAAGEAPDNRIIDKMILYAFGEAEAPPELGLPPGTKLPANFIGEFTVTARTPTSVTLSPTYPPQGGGGGTWTLYETMPIDGHPLFATDPSARADLNKNADEEPIFGVMDAEFLAKLLPPPRRGQNQSEEDYQRMMQLHQEILDGYIRDGKRAAESDSPDDVWLKVRFTQDHEEIVDSEAQLGGVEQSQDFFDRGRAEIPLLRRGGPAQFKKDEVGVFPQEEANNLINRGVAELIEPIYVRPLNDYEYMFRTIHERFVALREESQRVQRNIDELTQANDRTLQQISYRQQERDNLQQDLAKFVHERDQIAAYRGKLETMLSNTRTQLSHLFRTNQQLAQDLTRINQELTEEIDRRTREAVAGTTPTTAP